MIGLLRVKDEARWITRCLYSILPLCERILVMDDHSTDGTPDLCAAIPGVTVLPSPFTGINEARDKNWLLDKAHGTGTGWVLMIDGDEMLAPGADAEVRAGLESRATCFSFAVAYLWDREDQVRTDGVYGHFRRPSLFRPGAHRFESTAAGGNFHCGNAPLALQARAWSLDATLLHFGYLHKEDRIRKYNWYRSIDGANQNEDGYRHIVVGDLFPAESVFRHAGPLELASL